MFSYVVQSYWLCWMVYVCYIIITFVAAHNEDAKFFCLESFKSDLRGDAVFKMYSINDIKSADFLLRHRKAVFPATNCSPKRI